MLLKNKEEKIDVLFEYVIENINSAVDILINEVFNFKDDDEFFNKFFELSSGDTDNFIFKLAEYNNPKNSLNTLEKETMSIDEMAHEIVNQVGKKNAVMMILNVDEELE